MRATNFLERLEAGQSSQPLDFSTNGASIRFGLMLLLTTAFRHQVGRFDTVSGVDNFRIEVEPADHPGSRPP